MKACWGSGGDKKAVVMELLATGRVDFGAADSIGITPLMGAVQFRDVATVQAMVLHALDPIDLLREDPGYPKRTATERARNSNRPDMIAFVESWAEVHPYPHLHTSHNLHNSPSPHAGLDGRHLRLC